MDKSSRFSSPLLRQTWVVSSIFLNALGLGLMLGFTSGLLTDLKAPDSNINLSLDASSWLVSSLPMSAAICFFPLTYLISKAGRKIAFIINTIPILIGIVITIFANSFVTLLLGRILVGGPASSATSLCVMVIGEYTTPRYRGMFLNLKTFSLSLGVLVVHVLGHYYNFRIVAVFCLVPFVISMAITFTWPESPCWLAERRRIKESESAFYWLRGKSEDSRKEIEELIREQQNKVNIMETPFSEQIVSLLQKFTKRNFLKPALVFIFATILIETSGRHIFPSYAAQILKEMVKTDINTFHYNVAIDLMICISSLLTSFLIIIINLRVLLFTTGVISFMMLNSTCLILYLINIGVVSDDLTWVPLVLFTIFFIFSSTGGSCLPIALMGEIFPLEHRAIGSATAGSMMSVGMILTLKLMPLVVVKFAIHGAFSIMSACLGLSLVVLYFILPETRNKTLLEIEHYFNYGKYRDGELVASDDVVDSDCEKPMK